MKERKIINSQKKAYEASTPKPFNKTQKKFRIRPEVFDNKDFEVCYVSKNEMRKWKPICQNTIKQFNKVIRESIKETKAICFKKFKIDEKIVKAALKELIPRINMGLKDAVAPTKTLKWNFRKKLRNARRDDSARNSRLQEKLKKMTEEEEVLKKKLEDLKMAVCKEEKDEDVKYSVNSNTQFKCPCKSPCKCPSEEIYIPAKRYACGKVQLYLTLQT